MTNAEEMIEIVYTNYKGNTAIRKILPIRIHYGSTQWHKENQWLLTAIDVEKDAERNFALKDIKAWL